MSTNSYLLFIIAAVVAIGACACIFYLIYSRKSVGQHLNAQLTNHMSNINSELKLQLSEIKNNLLEKTHQLAQDTHTREVQHITTMQKTLQTK